MTLALFPADKKIFDLGAFGYQYAARLEADQNSFWVDGIQIAFPDAREAEVIAPFNRGDTMFLIRSKGKLFSLNPNEKKTFAVLFNGDAWKLRAYPSGNRYRHPAYFEDGARVYFRDTETAIFLPLDADRVSFKANVSVYNEGTYWGSDASHVFVRGSRLAEADPKTFAPGMLYAMDSRRVYFFGPHESFLLTNADRSTFQEVDAEDHSFDAMDRAHRYRRGKTVR